MSGRPREFDDLSIIEAAMDVFWSNGYEGSSAQALVDNTGLGRGSLYNAFGSKQKLYHQALRHYHELGLQKQRALLEAPGTAKERLRALLEWAIEDDLNQTQKRSCMALFAALERSNKDMVVDKITRTYVAKLEQILCHVFALGQRNGELSSQRSPLEMSRAFLSSYYGLRVLGQSLRDKDFLQDVLEGTMAQL